MARKDTVTKSILDSPLIQKFIVHSIVVCLICIGAFFGKYIGKAGGFMDDLFGFIINVYKFPAYYLVKSIGGDVDGLRLFFYLMIDMGIISLVTFLIRTLITGELKKEIESYRGE